MPWYLQKANLEIVFENSLLSASHYYLFFKILGTFNRLHRRIAGVNIDAGLIACNAIARIDVPAMLVYGGESNFYRTETAHYVASQIPDAILHIYEGTDHSPHQWQRERFTRELIAFVNNPA